MLIFDEKKYAIDLLKNKEFNTYRKRDIERYILIRYLASEGLSSQEIRKEIDKFPLVGCEYLDKKEVDIIYNKILEKALSQPLVTGVVVNIYKSEIDIINSIENEEARNLLFVLLVYYKWAVKQSNTNMYFFSRYNNTKMVLVNDLDMWKNAGLMKLRKAERYKVNNILINKGLYVEDNFKSNNYFYLPFSVDSGDIAFSVSNFDNILGELLYYNDPDSYKRCQECGMVIKKTRSPKKYCAKCAKIVKNRQNKEYYNLGKTKSDKTVEK